MTINSFMKSKVLILGTRQLPYSLLHVMSKVLILIIISNQILIKTQVLLLSQYVIAHFLIFPEIYNSHGTMVKLIILRGPMSELEMPSREKFFF